MKTKKKKLLTSCLVIACIGIISASAYFIATKSPDQTIIEDSVNDNLNNDTSFIDKLNFKNLFRSATIKKNNKFEINEKRLYFEIMRELTSVLGNEITDGEVKLKKEDDINYLIHIYLKTKTKGNLVYEKKLTFKLF